jgi:hypothetical protein
MVAYCAANPRGAANEGEPTMIRNKLALAAVALAGALGAGLAQARDDVRFLVTIGTPAPVVAAAPAYVPAYVATGAYGYRAPEYRTPWDRDHDRVPNRYDRRAYSPRGDRDHDGIPNRYDRVYNPRWDRDGDGLANWRDPHPDRYDGRRDWRR